MDTDTGKDFFISYTHADTKWAEWIAWQLEEAQYSTILQAWDFQPGMNFVLEMDKAATVARCTIAVLSPDYLSARYTQPEWADAFRRDPTSEKDALIPVRVRSCEVMGLLGSIIYIDLVDLDEVRARETLLAAVRRERGKPKTAPGFPGGGKHLLPEPQSFPGSFPPIWNIPFLHNPFFTGRTEILETIYHGFTSQKTTPLEPQALCGMTGIGKTQIALEYAYRYRNDYDTILWVKADSLSVLTSDFVSLANLLNLPEKDEQEEKLVIQAVKHWFDTRSKLLLIFDGANELQLVWNFLPTACLGHILLTTQTQSARRLMKRIVIEQMDTEEGIRFLLHRANPLLSENALESYAVEEVALAEKIVELMEGHPLALDQAGAYIEETNCSLSDYQQLYRKHQIELLKRRGDLTFEHPESVATAISLSIRKVAHANFAATELLYFLAFLHPDAIPEEIISEGWSYLGPLRSVASDPHKLNEAVSQLLRYSLISRNPEKKTLRMHRLIQTLSKNRMKEETQRRWSERTVQAVNQVFASPGSQDQERYWLYMPHVYECETHIKQWEISSWEALELLVRAGSFLRKADHYAEADPLVREALDRLYQDSSQPNFYDVESSLADLSYSYYEQGKYEVAEPLMLRVLTITERMLGLEHPDTARSLNNLSGLYFQQGKYEQAEPLFQRALAIVEKQLGPEHPNTATSLNNLAALYGKQGKYEQAEPLFQRALRIHEQKLGLEHPDTATSLNNLANLYREQGKYEQAEPLYQRALAIREQQLGPAHPDTATSRDNYHDLRRDMQRKEKGNTNHSPT